MLAAEQRPVHTRHTSPVACIHLLPPHVPELDMSSQGINTNQLAGILEFLQVCTPGLIPFARAHMRSPRIWLCNLKSLWLWGFCRSGLFLHLFPRVPCGGRYTSPCHKYISSRGPGAGATAGAHACLPYGPIALSVQAQAVARSRPVAGWVPTCAARSGAAIAQARRTRRPPALHRAPQCYVRTKQAGWYHRARPRMPSGHHDEFEIRPRKRKPNNETPGIRV